MTHGTGPDRKGVRERDRGGKGAEKGGQVAATCRTLSLALTLSSCVCVLFNLYAKLEQIKGIVALKRKSKYFD